VASLAGSDVRLAELIASISLATDLGLGQPMEHVLRDRAAGRRARRRRRCRASGAGTSGRLTRMAREPDATDRRAAPRRYAAAAAAAISISQPAS
jgi:hypothetical protein